MKRELGEFQQHAPTLAANGYSPVPIARGTKAPLLEGWQRYSFSPADTKRFAREGVGLLTKHTPAIDIDIRHAKLADKVQALAEGMLGLGPVRIGQPPKRVLLYRASTPFPKIKTREFRCDGDPPSAKGHHVELLGDGQQVVAYAIHPDTREPYRWTKGRDPISLKAADLAEIDGAKAAAFIRAADELIAREPGFAAVSGPATVTTGDGAKHEGAIASGERNNRLAALAGSMRRAGTSVEAIEAALRIENATRCKPPLKESEVTRIAASVGRYEPHGQGPSIEWPLALDLSALAKRDPQPPKVIIPDWGPTGYAWLIAGHGGAGKSLLVLHLAVCMASGKEFFGLPVEHRRVLLLSCEDRADVVHWRLSRICAHLGIKLASLGGSLDIVDLVGHESVLWMPDLRTGNAYTAAYGALHERVSERESEVLIVDGISDTFGGNENSRTDVKRYVNALLGLIPADRGALLLVGHVNKMTAGNGVTSEGYSGSTGWHNACRARWHLYPEMSQRDERTERTGDLILDLQKSNLGRTDQTIRLAWDESANLFTGKLVSAGTALDRAKAERSEQLGIMTALFEATKAGIIVPAATTGKRTAYNVLSARPELPGSLMNGKAAARRFWRHVEVLRQRGEIVDTAYKRPDGHKAVRLAVASGVSGIAP